MKNLFLYELKNYEFIMIKEGITCDELYFFLTFLNEILLKYKSNNYKLKFYKSGLNTSKNRDRVCQYILSKIEEEELFNMKFLFIHKKKSDYLQVFYSILKEIKNYILKNNLNIEITEYNYELRGNKP